MVDFSPFSPGPSNQDPKSTLSMRRRGLFHRTASEPVQLTSGPIEWGLPVFSKDGKKIFATGSTRRGELERLDSKSNQFKRF